jgi:transcription factor IIIB 90 kDa subunit
MFTQQSWRIFLQRRKANNKPRDATDPTGSTAAESVRTLLKKNPKYSKRINYNALKGLFEDGGAEVEEDKDDGVIYGLSDADKSDGDTMVVDEDAREALPPSIPPISRKRSAQAQPDVVEELGGEYNDMESEKGDEYVAWDDPFEQEAF